MNATKIIVAAACVVLVIPAIARPILQPEVKEYRALGGAFDAKSLPVFHQDQRQCEIAAGETRARGMVSAWDGRRTNARGIYIAVAGTGGGQVLAEAFGLSVPEREQGYAIVAKDGRVAIVGRDPVGALYGAVTYGQMSVDGTCENAVVRDWPDYAYRGDISLGRGLYNFGNGDKDRRDGMKAGIDMMLRMKLNVMNDYFWIRPGASEESYAYWRELTRYAEERGIYADPKEHHMSVRSRDDKPEGLEKFSDWPCVKTHKSWQDYYYCWADDAATERAATRYADFLEKIGINRAFICLHPVDNGFWQDPEGWSRRCEKCRARWDDHERWKASVNQYDIWTKVLNARLPNATVYSPVYPYTFSMLTTPEEKRTEKWKESMPEYWSKVDAGLKGKTFYFWSWMYPRGILGELRQLMPTRPFCISEPFLESAGLFVTFHRKIGSAFEPTISNRIMLRSGDSDKNWESVALFAEYAWNINAPGAEPYDGSTFYDPLVDHTGPKDVMDAHLHRICFVYWGEALAPFMEKAMASGLMPKYIEDPGYYLKYWNSIRHDPLFDPNIKKTADLATHVPMIEDSAEMMDGQVRAAEECVKALEEASAHLDGIDRFKRKYFMRLKRMAPQWLAAARTRACVRMANDAVAKGDNPTALSLLEIGRRQMEADYDAADRNLQALADEPTTLDTWLKRSQWKLGRAWATQLFDRAEASAKITFAPRKIGKKVKIGIVGSDNRSGDGRGIKEFFDSFENVEASLMASIDRSELDKYDCVFVRSAPYEKEAFFDNLRAYAEWGGGGVWLEGYICGHKRFSTKTPFPEIVKTSPERMENPGRGMKFSDGRVGETMYVDYFELIPGQSGEVRATSTDGRPIAVRGECGLGKVFFCGTFSIASVGGTYGAKPLKLFGANAELAKEAVEWFTGVRLVDKRMIGGEGLK